VIWLEEIAVQSVVSNITNINSSDDRNYLVYGVCGIFATLTMLLLLLRTKKQPAEEISVSEVIDSTNGANISVVQNSIDSAWLTPI